MNSSLDSRPSAPGMAERIRTADWSATPLGPIAEWPAALRVAVNICLDSRFPMFVWWGPGLINLYNDAYVPILGNRHPDALGRPAKELWAEIWPAIGQEVDAVLLRGEASWNERVPLTLERNGFPEKTWFTWSYSPIRDDSGDVVGLFCANTEETRHVKAERERDALLAQLAAERGRLVEAFNHAPSLVAILRGPDHVLEYVNERFATTAARPDALGRPLGDAVPQARTQGFIDLLDYVYESGQPFTGTAMPARVRRADGLYEERRFDVVCQPLRDAGGPVTGILTHGVDVTERFRAVARDKFLIELDAATRPLTQPEDITAVYARLLGEHLAVDRCAYAEVEADEDTFTVRGDHNRGVQSIVGMYRFGQFGVEVLRLMRDDRAFVADDVVAYRPPLGDLSAYDRTQIRAVICVPLRKAGRFVAAMAVHQRVSRTWTAEEVDLVRHVAGRCWESIERARVRRNLRASEERFRAAFEQAAVGIAHVALDGRWLRVNQKLCAILGYTADELTRLTFQDITFADDIETDLANTRRLMSGELQNFSMQKRYVRSDKQVVWTQLTVSIVDGEPGGEPYFVSVIEDISERKLAEKRLLEETEVVETISNVGRALAAELDTQKLVQTITDAMTELTGAQFGAFFHNTTNENGQALGLYTLSGAPREAFEKFPLPRATALFGPTLRGQSVIRIDDVLKDERYGQNAPFKGMPAGHLPVRSYLAAPVKSRSGDVLGALLFGHSDAGVFDERAERIVTGVASTAAIALDNARLFEDAKKATEAKEALLASEQAARSEAERASRMKDEFLATLSHELRTPLNAILGWATILKSGPNDEADARQAIDTIERNARAQKQIIEDLLDMSRIVSGKISFNAQRVALEPVVTAAIKTVTPAAEAKGIRIAAALDPSVAPISGDPSRLQQVFWNLLSNAIKFTPAQGNVHVLMRQRETTLEVSVIDTGEGIAAEFLPHVFDRFRQADASITRRHGGLGLGLSIVKQLVELHGGTVRVESGGRGKGSAFIVALPVRVETPQPTRGNTPAGPSHASRPGVRLAGIKVLVVDDEPDVRLLVRRLVEDCGASVIAAGSVAEAMELLQTELPDVLVSDIGMPIEDGYSFIRRVRALAPSRGGLTPAVALTAYARTEDRKRSIDAGFQTHLPKPVEPNELVSTVATLAGRA